MLLCLKDVGSCRLHDSPAAAAAALFHLPAQKSQTALSVCSFARWSVSSFACHFVVQFLLCIASLQSAMVMGLDPV